MLQVIDIGKTYKVQFKKFKTYYDFYVNFTSDSLRFLIANYSNSKNAFYIQSLFLF